jgi:hypothetical protein
VLVDFDSQQGLLTAAKWLCEHDDLQQASKLCGMLKLAFGKVKDSNPFRAKVSCHRRRLPQV